MIAISIYFMLHLEIPRNTAYNCMIYITFFIVILIDKRDVKRDGKREREKGYNHITIYITIHRTIHRTIPPPRAKKGTAPQHPPPATTPPTPRRERKV